ncbi:MAG: hypothetical protein H6754_02025 [Candidatus Omnitrophica bacterium]|nr:hypothetical protein [Candidatus Omnitrophota bacterium]
MVKKLLVAGLCAAILTISSVAMAGDVVVTKRGKRYHAATCALILSKQTTGMDEQQAIAKGLKPCGKCLSDKEDKDNKSNKKEKK